jgi:predicted DNA-binding transcriptional regulator AlpA
MRRMKMIGVEKVSRIFGMSVESVWSAVRRGHFVMPLKVSRLWRWNVDELRGFIETGERYIPRRKRLATSKFVESVVEASPAVEPEPVATVAKKPTKRRAKKAA